MINNNISIKRLDYSNNEIDNIVEFLIYCGAELNYDTFKWKHINNIYGPSIIYYAYDEKENKVAASRSFWKQKVMYNNEILTVFQPCDTFTHHDYQRKGLFTALTKASIIDAKNEGAAFACNFPNYKSKGGYLKLSFQDIGGMEYMIYYDYLKLPKIIYKYITKTKDRSNKKSYELNHLPKYVNNSFSLSHRNMDIDKHSINPIITKKYLEWRFTDHPMINFYSYSNKCVNAIYYIGKRENLFEAKIAYLDILCDEKNSIRDALNDILKITKCDIISIYTHNTSYVYKKIHPFMTSVKTNVNFTFYPILKDYEISKIKWNIGSYFMDTF